MTTWVRRTRDAGTNATLADVRRAENSRSSRGDRSEVYYDLCAYVKYDVRLSPADRPMNTF